MAVEVVEVAVRVEVVELEVEVGLTDLVLEPRVSCRTLLVGVRLGVAPRAPRGPPRGRLGIGGLGAEITESSEAAGVRDFASRVEAIYFRNPALRI